MRRPWDWLLLSHQHQPSKAKPCPTKISACSHLLHFHSLSHGCLLLSQPHSTHNKFLPLQNFQGCQTEFSTEGLGVEQSPCSHSNHPQCCPCFACAILTPLPHHMAQTCWEQTHPFLLGSRYKDTQTIVCSYCKGKAGGKGSREGRKLH